VRRSLIAFGLRSRGNLRRSTGRRGCWSLPPARVAGLALSFVLLGDLGVALSAQSGAFVQVLPSNAGLLRVGDEIDVTLRLVNTSSSTPSPGNPGTNPLAATLHGELVLDLGCNDAACAARTEGVLELAPGGPNGCLASAAGVVACSQASGDRLVVALDPDGIPFAAGASVEIATVRLRVLDASLVSQTRLIASTATDGVQTCDPDLPGLCVATSAAGAAKLVFSLENPILPCGGSCPAKLRFIDGPAKPDSFEFHARIATAEAFDPENQETEIALLDGTAQEIFRVSLPAGVVQRQGDTFTFSDPGSREAGGIAFLRLTRQENAADLYRVDVQAYAETETLATDPLMTVVLRIGPMELRRTDEWQPREFGWQLDLR
jgi:hypothetical protein